LVQSMLMLAGGGVPGHAIADTGSDSSCPLATPTLRRS
jgi:hypothetical protein